MDFNKFNYIGSKYKLFPEIIKYINENVGENLENKTIGDYFSGTGIVSYGFRNLGCNVISNDYEYYGYVIGRAFTCSVYSKKIEKCLDRLQKVEPVEGLIYKNYSPSDEHNRMYFTVENAKKIDGIRQELEKLKENDINKDEYYYLLTCLLLAADKVANITSVYGAYLKKFKKSAEKSLQLKPLHKNKKKNKNKVYNGDIVDVIGLDKCDIVYLDPPYNSRQYSKNYHILNYITMYKDVDIKGVTGLLVDSNISMFCRKNEVSEQLKTVLERVKTKWLFMSYNSEGLLKKEEIVEMMKKYGNVCVKEIEHKRFKSNSAKNQQKFVIEYIFCLKIKTT